VVCRSRKRPPAQTCVTVRMAATVSIPSTAHCHCKLESPHICYEAVCATAAHAGAEAMILHGVLRRHSCVDPHAEHSFSHFFVPSVWVLRNKADWRRFSVHSLFRGGYIYFLEVMKVRRSSCVLNTTDEVFGFAEWRKQQVKQRANTFAAHFGSQVGSGFDDLNIC